MILRKDNYSLSASSRGSLEHRVFSMVSPLGKTFWTWLGWMRTVLDGLTFLLGTVLVSCIVQNLLILNFWKKFAFRDRSTRFRCMMCLQTLGSKSAVEKHHVASCVPLPPSCIMYFAHFFTASVSSSPSSVLIGELTFSEFLLALMKIKFR